MINLSFAAPNPPLTSTLPMPAAAGAAGGSVGDFSRSLDRVQAPRPSPPPASKVKIDADGERPDAAAAVADTAAESKRALDALGALQRTAAARQAALRSAAQAAESAKAAKTKPEGAGTEPPVAALPDVPVTECPVAGPELGPDCEFMPEAPPRDTTCIVLMPALPTPPPVEVAQPKRTLPAQLPDGNNGPALPPKLPPLVGDSHDPRLSGHAPGSWAGQPVKAGGPEDTPIRTDQPEPRSAKPTARSERDKALGPAGADDGHRDAVKGAAAPTAQRPSAPPVAADPGGTTNGPSTLPALLPAATLRPNSDATAAAAQNVAAVMAAAVPVAAGTGNEATVAAPLQARPGSSEFAQELGAQVAVWAKDGVQRASLQLNPLELGPVSVQITLDGTGAQVTLAADLAATRLALEQALPALAGSLREAGLTLTGGGVFDQTRQQANADGTGNGEGNGNGQRGSSADARRTLPAFEPERSDRLPLAAPRSRGVVDLMA